MEAIRQFIGRVVEEFAPDLSGQPTDDELSKARHHASLCSTILEECRPYIQEQVPDSPEVSSIVDQVLQFLREGHGGVLLDELLATWERARRIQSPNDRKIYTPREREALSKVLERWSVWEPIDKEFGGMLSDLFNVFIIRRGHPSQARV